MSLHQGSKEVWRNRKGKSIPNGFGVSRSIPLRQFINSHTLNINRTLLLHSQIGDPVQVSSNKTWDCVMQGLLKCTNLHYVRCPQWSGRMSKNRTDQCIRCKRVGLGCIEVSCRRGETSRTLQNQRNWCSGTSHSFDTSTDVLVNGFVVVRR